MTNLPAKRYVDYKKPPVVEVVCGVLFKPVEGLSTARIGQLWSHFGEGYTTTEDRPPLPQPMEICAPGGTFSPQVPIATFPRVWFITDDGHRVIQVQNGRLHFNWRKQEGDEDYPEFPQIYDQFKNHFQVFEAFVTDHGLPALVQRQFEVTYINVITENPEWGGLHEIGKLLPDLSWRSDQRFLPNPEHMAWEAKFLLEEEAGVLEVKAISTRVVETGAPAILLELTAKGPAKPDMGKWFDIGHRSIVRGFTDLTGERIQEAVWERMEDPS